MSNLFKSKFLLGVLVVAFMLVGFAVVKTNTVAAASCSITSTLRTGSTGVQVVCLQTGLGGLTADGHFGPKTKLAVMAWQAGHGLVADGIFGPKSRAVWDSDGGVSGNFPPGCTNASGFSITTGLACSSLNANTFSPGCTNASGFSITTGLACSSLNANTFPAGCTNASGFSTTTGYSCLTGFPVVRGGGSSGGNHATVESDDATLSSTSKIKGFGPLNPSNLGTPATTWEGVMLPGVVILTKEQAEDTSNATDFITLFIPTDSGATVTKVVEYADEEPIDFENDTAIVYTDAIPSGGLFIVKVTAEDSSILYYVIQVEVQAVGEANAATGTNTITYTLTAGTFDNTVAEVTTNWILGGDDFAELGAVTDVVLSVNDTVATITVESPIGADTKIYTITPTSDIFLPYFVYPAEATAVTVRTASTEADLDFTAVTGTSLDEVVVTDDTFDESGADEANAMPLYVTIMNANAAVAIFEPVSDYATITAYASNGSSGGAYVAVAASYDFSGANTTLWIKSIAEDASETLYYELAVTLASEDATIITDSEIKDKFVTDLGTSATTIAGIADAGAITISTIKADDAVGAYVTDFILNDAGATTKVVKYATGASTTGFATATDYADGAITDQDFFIVRVTAEDPAVVQYYKIVVTTVPDATEIVPLTATFENSAGSKVITITTLVDADGNNLLNTGDSTFYADSTGVNAFTYTLNDDATHGVIVTVTKAASSNALNISDRTEATTAGAYTLTITRASDSKEWTIDVTVTIPATADVDFVLTTPAADANNTITGGGATRAIAVDVVNTTASVVITGTKSAGQTVVVGGVDELLVTAAGTATDPTYTVDSSGIAAAGGSIAFTLTVSEALMSDIVYTVTVTVVEPATDVLSPSFTTVAGNNNVTVTLTGGTFKIGVIDAADFIFTGADELALEGATTFTRTNDTVVTITGLSALGGINNTVTVLGEAQLTQATSVAGVASTLFEDVISEVYTTVTGNNDILITLTGGGTFKAGEIDTADFIFQGAADWTVIAAATSFTRASDTEVIIAGIGALAGFATNTVTVLGEAQAIQATGVTVVASTVNEYAIGDIGPAGGWIFGRNGTSNNYIESAPANFHPGTKRWSATADDLATSNAMGTGQANTNTILASLGAQTSTSTQFCAGLEIGANDWFLPSLDELSSMYTNLKLAGLGGFLGGNASYWSSSQFNISNASVVDFTSGTPGTSDKSANMGPYTRCVRAFHADKSIGAPITATFAHNVAGDPIITVTALTNGAGVNMLGDFTTDNGTDFSYILTNGGTPATVTKAGGSANLTIATPADASDAGVYTLTITRVNGGVGKWAIAVTVADDLLTVDPANGSTVSVTTPASPTHAVEFTYTVTVKDNTTAHAFVSGLTAANFSEAAFDTGTQTPASGNWAEVSVVEVVSGVYTITATYDAIHAGMDIETTVLGVKITDEVVSVVVQ